MRQHSKKHFYKKITLPFLHEGGKAEWSALPILKYRTGLGGSGRVLLGLDAWGIELRVAVIHRPNT